MYDIISIVFLLFFVVSSEIYCYQTLSMLGQTCLTCSSHTLSSKREISLFYTTTIEQISSVLISLPNICSLIYKYIDAVNLVHLHNDR